MLRLVQMSGDHPSSSQTATSAIPLRHLSPNHQLRIPPKGDVNKILNDEWARIRGANPAPSNQQSIPQEPITVSSSSPALGEDDLASTYRAEDMDDPLHSLNEFLDDLEGEVTGPSKVGLGKGKQLRFCDKAIRERAARLKRGEVNEEEEDNQFFESATDGEDDSTDSEKESGQSNCGASQGDPGLSEVDSFPAYDKNYSSPPDHPYSQSC